MSEAQQEAPVAKLPPEASIEVTSEGFVVKAPFALGKMGVYGIFHMAIEEASKFFYAQERRAREEQAKAQSLIGKIGMNNFLRRK